MCHRQYAPWVEDANKLVTFNKLLLSTQGADLALLPAWWPQSAEQKFLNLLKEWTLQVQQGRTPQIDYNAASASISAVLAVPGVASYPQPDFLQLEAPTAALVVADLAHCKGFEHCPAHHRTSGFWLPVATRNIPKEQVFNDYDSLITSLAHFFPHGAP